MISLIHKTIFIHIPKCAEQSVEETFMQDLGLTWDNHRYLFACFQKPTSWSANLPQAIAHATAYQYIEEDLISQELFDAFYKFAIVRDPIDRVISMWKYLNIPGDFDEFVKNTLPLRVSSGNYWFRPQKQYLCAPSNNQNLVDDVLPFSKLESSWLMVKNKTGLKSNLTHRNSSARNKQLVEVSQYAVDVIKDIYSEDYQYFKEF